LSGDYSRSAEFFRFSAEPIHFIAQVQPVPEWELLRNLMNWENGALRHN